MKTDDIQYYNWLNEKKDIEIEYRSLLRKLLELFPENKFYKSLDRYAGKLTDKQRQAIKIRLWRM
jgi:hypothetical protein